jgi:hypothetical protein
MEMLSRTFASKRLLQVHKIDQHVQGKQQGINMPKVASKGG